jgi:hypothetical protein
MTAFDPTNNDESMLSPWWFPGQGTLCVAKNPHQPVKPQMQQMHSDQPSSWLWRDSTMAKHKLIAEKLLEISKFPSHQETRMSDEALVNILTQQFHMTGDSAVTRRMLNCAASQDRVTLASAGDCNNTSKEPQTVRLGMAAIAQRQSIWIQQPPTI